MAAKNTAPKKARRFKIVDLECQWAELTGEKDETCYSFPCYRMELPSGKDWLICAGHAAMFEFLQRAVKERPAQ